MADPQDMGDVTFTPPTPPTSRPVQTPAPTAAPTAAPTTPAAPQHDMSDVTFTPPSVPVSETPAGQVAPLHAAQPPMIDFNGLDPISMIQSAPSIFNALQQSLQSSQHPFAREIGQKLSDAHDLLFGGPALGVNSHHGVADEANLLSGAVGGAEMAPDIVEGVGNIASKTPGAVKDLVRKVLIDPVTKEPTITPGPIIKRVLRTQQEVDDAAYEQKAQALMDRGYEQAKLDLAHEQRLKEVEDARQKQLAAVEKLKEQHAKALVQRGQEQSALDDAHANRLSEIENTRQKELAAQERLKTMHGSDLQRRGEVTEAAQKESDAATHAATIAAGKRPSEAEEYITNLMHKSVLTPEEFENTEKILGSQAKMRPDEGIATWRARILGLVRAGRSAKEMPEPPSFPSGTPPPTQ